MNIMRIIEDKKRAKARQARLNKAKSLSLGLTAGACIGALSGVLLAPKSGKETRNDIVNGANDLNTKLKDKTNDLTVTAKTNIQDAKGKIQDYLASKKNSSKESTVTSDVSNEEVIKEEINIESSDN